MRSSVHNKIERMPASTGAIIRKLMVKRNLKEADLARQIGLPQTTVNRLLLHEKSDPRINTLMPIAHFFGVTLGQLVGLEPITDSSLLDVDSFIMPVVAMNVPLIDWGSIYEWLTIVDRSEFRHCKRWICTERPLGKKAYALDSMPFMDAVFLPNATIMIDPDHPVRDGSYVVVILHGIIPTVRKVLCDGSDWYFKPFDSNLPMQKREKEHKVLGTVVESRMACN